MSKRLILTAHAQIRLRERRLDPTWVEDAARNPDWVEPEPRDVRLSNHGRLQHRLKKSELKQHYHVTISLL
jgi:hypothetical protein